jgi:hypothetical protein
MSGYAQWNPATTYSADEIVSYVSALWQSLQTTTNNPPNSSPLYWIQVGGGGAVSSIVAGTGIAVSGASTVTISNTGVLSVSSAGTGITIGGTSSNPTVANDGVLSVSSAGTGITIGGTAQNPTVQNDGVLSVASAGTGITIGGTSSNPTVANDGVLALTAGSGVSITGSPSNYTISATGSGGTITGIGAGYNISVDNTNPAVPVVAVTANQTSQGGSISILSDAGGSYYGLLSFQPTLLTLDPANNGAPSNQWRAGGLTDINVLANPQTGGTDLTVQIVFSQQLVYGRLFQLTLGVPATIYNNNSSGNNNMNVQVVYEDPTGSQIVVPSTIQISPQQFVIIKAISPLATNSNGTPYSYIYQRPVTGNGGIL